VAAGGAPAEDPLTTLASTVEYAFPLLQAQAEPAHWLGYSLVETEALVIQGTHGALGGVERNRQRELDVDVRVGTARRDSSHKLRDASWFSERGRSASSSPLDGPGSVLRRLALRDTDDNYRTARARLIKIRANDAVKVEREDDSDDWGAAPPVVATQAVTAPVVDEAGLTRLAREVSAVYLDYPAVHDSAAQVRVETRRRWLATSDGTRLADGRNFLRFATWAQTTADDGERLQVYAYVDAATVGHLPGSEAAFALAKGAAERLTELRAAPLVDPWAGPAILRGRAAGVFFHEIFGHRVEGHRQKDEDEGQTFTSRVGQPILPEFLSVHDDPTLATVDGTELNGTYAWDDEGVAAERVSLVDHGVLRNFLLSRSPIAHFPASNGHGRRAPGHDVVPRQGNLLVTAHRTVPYPQLRRMLLDEVARQKKDFGLVFDDISGGFTFTGRSDPNAFSVQPVTVWKVFPDGRPDQLVRGVDLIGTPLATFARIAAAADDIDVFNGICGAESGWVPVSAAAPSLLVREVEVQRKEKANDRPPVLGAP
jgi:predicted Zn-dependent protease